MNGWSDGAQFLRDLELIAGRAVVDRFLGFVGGTRVYIPRARFDAGGSRMAEALGGPESASVILEKLAPLYGGLNLEIPLHGMSSAKRRRKAIDEALIRGGVSASQIATLYGVHERTVYNRRRHLREIGLLELTILPTKSPVKPEVIELIEFDLLTHPQPDVRSNDEIAQLHGGTTIEVNRARGRLIKLGLIPSRSNAGPHG